MLLLPSRPPPALDPHTAALVGTAVTATLRDFTAWFALRSIDPIPNAADVALLLLAAGCSTAARCTTATREGTDPDGAADDNYPSAANARAFMANPRTAALAAGAFGPGGPAVNPHRCLWMLGAAPRRAGVDRRPDDSSSDSYGPRSDFCDAEGGVYAPDIHPRDNDLDDGASLFRREYRLDRRRQRRESRSCRRLQQAARVEAITAVARRLLRAAPEAVLALTLYPTTAPSTVLRAAMATQPTAMRALRLEFFHMSQGLAVTLLRRACLAWAESLREVRVDVGKEWRLEISNSIYIALAGCPHLETLSVPDIFIHYYAYTDNIGFEDANAHLCRRGAGPHRTAPRYFRTLRHLDLHDGPHTRASWHVICAKLPALHTLILRFQRQAPGSDIGTVPLTCYRPRRLKEAVRRAGSDFDLLTKALSVPVDGNVSSWGHRSPLWCAGFSTLLKRIKRLYINGGCLPVMMEGALNDVASSASRVRRRRRSSSSRNDSHSDRETEDEESDRSDAAARNATFHAARARAGATTTRNRPPPPFIRKRPRHHVAAKDMIPLEVFSLYGWRLDDMTEMTPFMRYLARSAPHLREVGLVNASASAVVALRHAVSTSLTGLDLRYIEDLDDLDLATLLRSHAGRRLRFLRVERDTRLFEHHWPYAVLARHKGGPTAMSFVPMSGLSESDSDATSGRGYGNTGDYDNGSTAPLESAAAAANAGAVDVASWRLGPEPRLRRLRRVHVRMTWQKNIDLAHTVFNGPRVVFAPYAVVPPL
jgi:hypothetical protein